MTDANQVCITTRCRTVDELVATFRRYVDADAIFVAGSELRAPGQETAFVVVLADGQPMLRGRGVVRATWETADNPYESVGFLVGIRELTPRSREVFARMQGTRDATLTSLSPPLPPRTPAEGAPCATVRTVTTRQFFAPVVRAPSPSELDSEDSFSAPTRVNSLALVAPSIAAPVRSWWRRVAWAFGGALIVAVAVVGVARATSGVPASPAGLVARPPAATAPALVGEGPCRLSVHATPAGASVELDGVVRGASPITLAAPCGQHRVDVTHPTHRTLTAWTALAAGQPERIEVTLARPIHAVWVTSEPTGAAIYIDGKPAGETPQLLNVLGHVPLALELRKPGYRPTIEHVFSTAERERRVIRLAPAGGARPSPRR